MTFFRRLRAAELGETFSEGENALTCDLCPRRCGALRTETEGHGACRMPEAPVVARAALHRWEEPPISGTRGAGTVFFSGCSLGCVFCQNDSISQGDFGREIPVERLREIFRELAAQGAHNIDLVNPTHYAHAIAQVLEAPLPVPVVWNSGGYDRVETLRALEGKIDIYLPDYKYPDAAGAKAYAGAADYPEVAQAAIREMVRQTGPCVFDGEGLLRRGVVIRHLLLPGRLAQAKEVMDWVAGTFPPDTVLPGAGPRNSRPWTAPCGAARSGGRRPTSPTWGWRASPRGWRPWGRSISRPLT